MRTASKIGLVLCVSAAACLPETPTEILPDRGVKPPTACRLVAEDELGLGEAINVAAGPGRFLVAAKQGTVAVSQAYTTLGERVTTSRYSELYPLPHTRGTGRVDLLFGTQQGYFLSSWDDNGTGAKNWLSTLTPDGARRTTYIPDDIADPFEPPSAGTLSDGAAYITNHSYDGTKQLTYVTAYKIESDQSPHPQLFGSSAEFKGDGPGGKPAGMARYGKTLGIVVRHFGIDGRAYLSAVGLTYGNINWTRFEVADPLSAVGPNDPGFTVRGVFAEGDNLSVAWSVPGETITHLRSFDVAGTIHRNITLSGNITDIKPVPGGYLAAEYDPMGRAVSAALYDVQGRVLSRLPFAITTAACLPAMAWNAESGNALFAWIDESLRVEKTTLTRTVHCE